MEMGLRRAVESLGEEGNLAGQNRRFIAEEVEVREAGPGEPVSFLWRGREYRIVEVVGVKRHLDFRRPWWQRRHRDYYRVRTDTGQTFELYFHRGPGRKYWVLYKEVGEVR